MPRMNVLKWGLSTVQQEAKMTDEEKKGDTFMMLLPQHHNTFNQG